jgi:hypothetical protein
VINTVDHDSNSDKKKSPLTTDMEGHCVIRKDEAKRSGGDGIECCE